MPTFPCHDCGHPVPERREIRSRRRRARRDRRRAAAPAAHPLPASPPELSPRATGNRPAWPDRGGRGRGLAVVGTVSSFAGERPATRAGPAAARAHRDARYVVHGSRMLERASPGRPTRRARPRSVLAGDQARRRPPRRARARRRGGARRTARLRRGGRAVDGVGGGGGLALATPSGVSSLALVTPAHLGRPSPDLDRWDRLARGPRAAGRGLPRGPRSADPRRALARLGADRDPPADRPPPAPRRRRGERCGASRGRRRSTASRRSRGSPCPRWSSAPRRRRPRPPPRAWRRYSRRIPGARLLVEDEGESPLAWRGGALLRRSCSSWTAPEGAGGRISRPRPRLLVDGRAAGRARWEVRGAVLAADLR